MIIVDDAMAGKVLSDPGTAIADIRAGYRWPSAVSACAAFPTY